MLFKSHFSQKVFYHMIFQKEDMLGRQADVALQPVSPNGQDPRDRVPQRLLLTKRGQVYLNREGNKTNFFLFN